MPAVDAAPAPEEAPPARPRRRLRRPAVTPVQLRWGLAVGAIVLGSFLLRVWGVGNGLPYAYNTDENAHFVPKAIGLFGHGLNPHYFVNPPGFTYVLHVVFAVWFGGRAGVSSSFAADPTDVFVVARVTSAALGAVAVWLLYLAGARLFADRRVGLLAAALLGVAFLPVFYSHLALNDVPTLAPLCLALWAIAGVLRFGRTRDYVLAGFALGLACAFKYTAGIVLLALVAAAVVHGRDAGTMRVAVRGLLIAGLCAGAGFFVGNPYGLLAPREFHEGLVHQTSTAGDAFGKLGLAEDNGWRYYLWSLSWGLGWVPLVAAVAGFVLLVRRDPRIALVLAPAPLLFILYMGTNERYFGRWLMPVVPLLCLLAAWAAVQAAEAVGRRRASLLPAALALAAVALCGQSLVHSVHLGRVLARDDTRTLAREWAVATLPGRTKVVFEPGVVPDAWAQDVGRPSPDTANGNRWVKYHTSRSNVANDGSSIAGAGRVVNVEDYERTLFPELIDRYEEGGYCWVLTGSTQRGRAEAEPGKVPRAIAYYRELERRGTVAFRASPYRAGADPVKFNFDWSYDYYPMAYDRPGPDLTVYRLHGGACA
jgi:hypothetical protein